MNQPMTDDDSMNLSKYLSSAGVCSRRGAAELVAGGAVAVNGTTAQSPGQRVTRKDRVTLHGKPVAPVREYVYIMLHKPRGYVCTMEDPHAKKKAVDLIPLSKEIRIVSVGRLDKDSEGLLLFSNDGDFIARLTHPRYEVRKIYQVSVEGEIDPVALHRLTNDGIRDRGDLLKAVGERVGPDAATAVRLLRRENDLFAVNAFRQSLCAHDESSGIYNTDVIASCVLY